MDGDSEGVIKAGTRLRVQGIRKDRVHISDPCP
jgi:hypothetical protein